MSMDTAAQQTLAELEARGSALYESLKTSLEPAHDRRFVAIHVDSGDYVVARSSGEAMRGIRKRHAEGRLYLRKIGTEPEYGLAARLLASEFTSGKRK